MYYSFLDSHGQHPETLKNGHVYNVKPLENKIQLIEQRTPVKPTAPSVWEQRVKPGLETVVEQVKLFVDEYMGANGKYSWFWFLMLFVFCVVLLCFLVRIQMRIDFVMSKVVNLS